MLRIPAPPTSRLPLTRTLAPRAPSFSGGGVQRPGGLPSSGQLLTPGGRPTMTMPTPTGGSRRRMSYVFTQGVRYSAGAAPSFLEAPLLPVVLERMGFSDVAVYERAEAPAHLTEGRLNDPMWTHVATGVRTGPTETMSSDKLLWANDLDHQKPLEQPPGSPGEIPPPGDRPDLPGVPTPWTPAEPQPAPAAEESGVSPVVVGLGLLVALGGLYLVTR